MGIPVVIASNGRGICVRNVTSGAPVMTVATNGFGIPIVLGTTGIPFVVQGAGPATLATLSLSGTLRNNLSSSGTILGATPTSTIVSNVSGLTVNSGARTYTWDGTGAAGSTSNGLVETLVGATGSPKSTSITVLAAVTLATLSLSGTITNGTSSSGTITGASTGSTIVSNVTGLSVNSGARTYSWDGTGAAGSTSNGLVETLSGAIGSPKNSSINVAASGTATAPVLTKTSASGANPMTWSSVYADITPDSDYITMRWRVNSGSFTNETNHLFTSSDYMDFLDGTASFAWPLYGAATFVNGDFVEVQEGVLRGAGPTVWGSIISDTMVVVSAETPSTWSPTTGTNKSQYVTIDTGNLRVLGQTGFNNAPISTRATLARTGKRQFQTTLTYTSTTSVLWIGVDDGTSNFNSGFVRPGKDNSAGISLGITPSEAAIWVGTVKVQSVNPPDPVTGDKLTCKFDTAGGTVSFYLTQSGTTTQIGTSQAVTMSSWYANAGVENADAQLAQFLTGQARTLDSGYVPYDN